MPYTFQSRVTLPITKTMTPNQVIEVLRLIQDEWANPNNPVFSPTTFSSYGRLELSAGIEALIIDLKNIAIPSVKSIPMERITFTRFNKFMMTKCDACDIVLDALFDRLFIETMDELILLLTP